MRNIQTKYSTNKLTYQELRARLISAKKSIHYNYIETQRFFGKLEANCMRYELAQMLELPKLRREAISARYGRG